jgi:hypothetical protein
MTMVADREDLPRVNPAMAVLAGRRLETQAMVVPVVPADRAVISIRPSSNNTC